MDEAQLLDADFVAARHLNNSDAVKHLQEAAAKSNHSAEAYLAICHYYGSNVSTNDTALFTSYLEKSIDWLQSEVPKGNRFAQFLLGSCLWEGIGMKADIVAGAKLLKLSADQGHSGAQKSIGKTI